MFSILVPCDPLFRLSINVMTEARASFKELEGGEPTAERGPSGGSGINSLSAYSAKRHHQPSTSLQEYFNTSFQI